jgi:hypothetical protein
VPTHAATAPPTEAFATAALAALPDVAMLVLDADLRVVCAAGGALDDAGWPPALVEGRRLEDVLPRDVHAVLASRYRLALEGRSIVFDHAERRRARVWRVQAIPLPADLGAARIMVIVRAAAVRPRVLVPPNAD